MTITTFGVLVQRTITQAWSQLSQTRSGLLISLSHTDINSDKNVKTPRCRRLKAVIVGKRNMLLHTSWKNNAETTQCRNLTNIWPHQILSHSRYCHIIIIVIIIIVKKWCSRIGCLAIKKNKYCLLHYVHRSLLPVQKYKISGAISVPSAAVIVSAVL